MTSEKDKESGTNTRIHTPENKHGDTIFIFDWDDTILPTTYLMANECDVHSETPWGITKDLAEFGQNIVSTLTLASRMGHVLIVTNSEIGWVEMTCIKFLPMVTPLLEHIPVLSARSVYEPIYGANPVHWKKTAFHNILASFPKSARNIISFGDSPHEREALLALCGRYQNAHCKSLKFIERPDISQLSQEHSLIINCFLQIVNHEGPLDLCIQCQN